MRNKYSVFFIILSMVLALTSSIISFNNKNVFADENIINNEMCFESEEALLVDANSGNILYSKNENERKQIASMTKIMTMLITFNSIDKGICSLNDDVTVSERAMSMGGSQVFLKAGNKYKLHDLLKTVAVASANDSCVALAEHIAKNEDNFVKLMNDKCDELNLRNTKFVNATGLPKLGQYSCAKDVALMYKELIKYDEYKTLSGIWMDRIEHEGGRYTEISNTNKLIRFYNGCDCGKTGYTSEAGHCLCASAIKNDMRIIAVVLKAPDSKTRFKEISNLFDYGFENYSANKIINKNDNISLDIKVKRGKNNLISVYSKEDVIEALKTGEKKNYTFSYSVYNLKAPINIDDEIGEVTVYSDGIEYKTVKLYSKEQINKKSFFDYFSSIIKSWSI